MFCPYCHRTLPDDAKFCSGCGRDVSGGVNPAAPAAAPSAATASGPQSLSCPACGAPLKPVFGEMVVSCDYCGGTVTLGSGGWKEVNKHSMLLPTLLTPAAADAAIRVYVDQGFMHRHDFEESRIVEQKLSFIPFWVLPVSASTTYKYQDLAVGIGGTVATIAGAEVLGSILGGGRGGGYTPVPIFMGSPVNSTRAETISSTYEYPIVAVKGMSAYQPKDYKFALDARTFFDKKSVPAGAQVLNGDLGEDAAHHAAEAYVMQLQGEAAHKKHSMVSDLKTQVQVTEGELLHVPIWYTLLERKGEKHGVLIDAHAGRVIQTVPP